MTPPASGVKPSLVCTVTKGPAGYTLGRDLVLAAL